MNTPASTASAITNEQVAAAYTAWCHEAVEKTPQARMRKAIEAALAAPTPHSVGQVGIDAIWEHVQRYADEHAASIDDLRTYAAIEGAKRRKLAHEVSLRQALRELAERAAVEPSQPVPETLQPGDQTK